MLSYDPSPQRTQKQPYRRLREDPRYHELKRVIDNFPRDKMHRLKNYLKRLTKDV